MRRQTAKQQVEKTMTKNRMNIGYSGYAGYSMGENGNEQDKGKGHIFIEDI